MPVSAHADSFFADLSAGTAFEDLLGPAAFRPAPPEWSVFLTDVADSTSAIRAGRYREVNFLGAACIAAVLNACGRPNLPYAFGGDGAVLLVPPALHSTARDALISVVALARTTSGFKLRAGAVPVAECAGGGRDLGVARLQLAPGVDLALFSGGGLLEADRLIKADPARCFPEPDHPPPPNLEGLSCRWEPLASLRGTMLSLLVLPRTRPGEHLCRTLYRSLREASGAHGPVSLGNLRLRLGSHGAGVERRALLRGFHGWRGLARAATATAQLTATWLALRLNRQIGPFDPRRYLDETVQQTDSVKFDGMLRMVVDTNPDEEQQILDLLAASHQRGEIYYGTHRSSSALITCWVPAVFEGRHLHFIDGADGGYALAARNLKEQMRGAPDLRSPQPGPGDPQDQPHAPADASYSADPRGLLP